MSKVFIISECGVNHNGSVYLAKKMIEESASAGADAVKFQTFKAERLISRGLAAANYQKKSIGAQNQYEMLKRLELAEEFYPELYDYSKSHGIEFMSTPFDEECAIFLNRYVKRFKIGSGDIRNYPLLTQVSRFGKPVVISSGMSTLDTIENAINILRKNKCNKISLLHCTSAYPTPYKEANLLAIPFLKKRFGLLTGYSDHTEGIHVSIAAAALGAEIIEKHFTLDRSMPGPDQRSSIEPVQLKIMISNIRDIENALGKPQKRITASEVNVRKATSRFLVARRNIPKGKKLEYEDFTSLRSNKGIPVEDSIKLVGRRTKRNIEKGEFIGWNIFA